MFKFIGANALQINRVALTCRFYNTSANNDKLRLLFFGTDNFASTHLNALIKEKDQLGSCIESIDLVCPPDRKTGRKLEKITPSETKEVAELNDISIYHTPPHVKTLANWQVPSEKPYDLGVVVSFGYFIPPHIISSFQYGAVNVHPSLLPKYRGAAPIQHAIMYGDRETGVTIQELDDREFDAGRILAQEPFDLSTRPPIYSSLKEQLASVGSRMLVDTLRHLHQRKVNAVPQDVSKATKAPKIKKEWSDIDFLHMSAWQAEQMNRAIGEQYPLRTMYQIHKKKQSKNIVIQLLDLHLPDAPLDGLKESDPGSFSWDDLSQSLQIVFGDHSVIACRRFKVENKGVISASDFCNGYQTQGKFGVSLTLDDDLTIEKNKKKRAKMHQYAAQ